MENEKDAMELVQEFIKEYLHGNIDELKNFSFWDIEGTKYDGNQKGKFDGDNTKIVNAIYISLWKNEIHKLSCDNIGSGKDYRGDTINTFNTLFGSPIYRGYVANQFNFLEYEKKYIFEFYRTYQKIGNFYILPNKFINLYRKNESINTYRGKFFKDYFDTFLCELDKCFSTENNCNRDLYKLIKHNDFFFSKIKDIDDFLSKFYMDDYKDFNLERHFSHWDRNITTEQYKQFAFSYIQKATELINKRSEKLVEVLKEKYPELKENLTEN